MVTFFVLLILLILVVIFLANYNVWRKRISLSAPRFLMYHSVSEAINDVHPELVVRPRQFSRQINYLRKQGFNFYTVSEIVAGGINFPAIAMTFDDGFLDNYSLVFPVLKQLNIKATVYIAPEIDGISKLSKAQIVEMQSSGLLEFGAHTLSHANLLNLDSDSAGEEIIASKNWLEDVTKVPCETFAYPFGRFSDETVDLLIDSGFSSAVTVKKGIDFQPDPLRLKRISVLRSTNLLQFKIAIQRGRYRL